MNPSQRAREINLSVLLSVFIQNLLPVFLAAGAGYLLAAATQIEPKPISRVVFYIFSPCLVFILLTENQLDGRVMLAMSSFAIVQLLSVGLLTWLLARLARFQKQFVVAVVLAAMLPNAGNFGLSVNLFAFGEEALAQASLFFVSSAILSYTAGVYIASLGRSSYRQALTGLLKIPTIYAVVLALLFQRMGWELPQPVQRAAGVLADAAIPTMLVLLGVLLRQARWSGNLKPLALANSMRLLASPLLAFFLAARFGLQGVARQAGILEASMPTAVMATVLATEFDVEPGFMTAVVFTSTLLSPLTLTPLLAFLAG
jgi:predicted permease